MQTSAAKRAFALWYDALIHLWRAHGVGLPRQLIPAAFEDALEQALFAAGGIEGIFWAHGIGIVFPEQLLQGELCTAPLFGFLLDRLGLAALDGPVHGELLQRRPEAGEVEVHATDATRLEFLDAPAHSRLHAGFEVFPVLHTVFWFLIGARAADQKDRAVGRRFVFDVE